ncbi:MAG: UDP-glucose/GDP-mannose dehydrogenase family protein [Candidatus Marinimicrobia bacterium]|jgi:UDPglucose 6-dehydrogenase|nr:UDP-glucose/GDP-mannose dehydrogenase family protein [Candidatus Neomarinimicrobiota bacterium]MBT3961826.1 UDP-glucose/GDP-mannose dehydrogenase family protein [Candidatus Neomarinimicrobiota bacterium]MBT4382654.1 UDP-glucose/GDP-mannose dehydrogenase family protein [Candidatus Neomarinimicrobiota bacterium]MBT4636726.1 UDP-glucose/GDP-mannose dehydrogenase family protein [Candidatus Neomarinimicrobiota bacterium]MBT4685411.1 UDP-glucose/GDP-mannose dehydrogenase family protein [Candidatus
MKKITFIGTGYVGLVSGAGVSDFGHNVICADIASDKIEQLNKGEIPIYEPGLGNLVDRNVKAGRLSFTTEVDRAIQKADVIFIAVGTPQGENGDADLSAVYEVAETIGENLNGYKVICTKSTVPIGTGEQIIKIINQNKNKNSQFDYVSNPEFLREGSAVKDFLWPDRVVLGSSSKKAFDFMMDVYRPLFINETPIVKTSIQTAEMIKYASNAFLALKISYINEIANLCDEVDADIHEVTKAMGSDGRISPKFLHPGPGYGGSCFPKDTNALASLAKQKGLTLKTVEGAIRANQYQKERMVFKLNRLFNGDISGKTIAILGLAFKQETDDIRDSAALDMIQSLLKSKSVIKAYDPIANSNMAQLYPDVTYCTNWENAVKGADATVILTEWREFRAIDLNKVKELMNKPVILDTRNILPIKDLTRLGFKFDNVGRKGIKKDAH